MFIVMGPIEVLSTAYPESDSASASGVPKEDRFVFSLKCDITQMGNTLSESDLVEA